MRDVYATASDLMAAVVAEMEEQGVTLPAVRYVAPGANIVYDGEQLTVHMNQIYPGQPGAPGQDPFVEGYVTVMAVEYQVTIVRYTPGITDDGGAAVRIPSPTEIQASAQQSLADATALAQALVNVKVKGTLCSRALPVAAGPVSPQGPEGGVVVTIGLFTMPLL